MLQKNGKFGFEGVIDGIDNEMKLRPTEPETFECKIRAGGVDLSGTANPLDISLRVGDDLGAVNIRPEGKLKLEAGDDD